MRCSPTARRTGTPAGSRSSSADRERRVNLDTHIPVHLAYFTDWVGEDGTLRHFEDIYGYDGAMRDDVGY